MEYKTLSKDERNLIIVEFLLTQERDHYCHSINLERYESILLDDLLVKGEFRSRIQDLKNNVAVRIAEVEMIIAHTLRQLPPQKEIDTVLKKNKREPVK